MSRASWSLGLIAMAAIVWLESSRLPVAARLWTAVLLVPLPALMMVQARQLSGITELPRRAAYVSSTISLWILATITLAVVRLSRFAPDTIGFFSTPVAPALIWVVCLTAAGVGLILAFRAAGMRESHILRQLLPRSPADYRLFAVLSISAGICEEIAFRGFLLYALDVATGSTLLAVVVSSSAFGVLHAYQQPAGAVRAALLGAMLAIPLVVGLPIYVPMAAHAAIDLLGPAFRFELFD